jgi:hypothetical protein
MCGAPGLVLGVDTHIWTMVEKPDWARDGTG